MIEIGIGIERMTVKMMIFLHHLHYLSIPIVIETAVVAVAAVVSSALAVIFCSNRCFYAQGISTLPQEPPTKGESSNTCETLLHSLADRKTTVNLRRRPTHTLYISHFQSFEAPVRITLLHARKSLVVSFARSV